MWKRGRVMQYESAHVDGVESEVGVRSSHSGWQALARTQTSVKGN